MLNDQTIKINEPRREPDQSRHADRTLVPREDAQPPLEAGRRGLPEGHLHRGGLRVISYRVTATKGTPLCQSTSPWTNSNTVRHQDARKFADEVLSGCRSPISPDAGKCFDATKPFYRRVMMLGLPEACRPPSTAAASSLRSDSRWRPRNWPAVNVNVPTTLLVTGLGVLPDHPPRHPGAEEGALTLPASPMTNRGWPRRRSPR